MSDHQSKLFPHIDRLDSAKLTELARGIVTGQMLIADLNDHSWVSSLGLMIAHWTKDDGAGIPPNLGLILVPLAPHMGGYWINGTAPGVTLSAQLVAQEDLAELQEKVNTMNAALHPDGV